MAKDKKKSGKGEEKGQPITKNQILEVQSNIGDVSDQIDFIKDVLSDNPPKLEDNHINGLVKILEHIRSDTYGVLDILEELNFQAIDAEGGQP